VAGQCESRNKVDTEWIIIFPSPVTYKCSINYKRETIRIRIHQHNNTYIRHIHSYISAGKYYNYKENLIISKHTECSPQGLSIHWMSFRQDELIKPSTYYSKTN
jgi:hypothetical protein